MKKPILIVFVIFFGLTSFLKTSSCKDLRIMMSDVDRKIEEVLKKAFEEKKKAIEDKMRLQEKISLKKGELLKKISYLKQKKALLTKEKGKLKNKLAILIRKEAELGKKAAKIRGELEELVGFIRVNTKELDLLLRQSPQSAFLKHRNQKLKPILEKLEFPGMDHIKTMVKLLFEEILLSGQVRVQKGKFVNRRGEEVTGDILMLGNFTSAYRTSDEAGFLLYSDKSKRFFALSRLPSRKIRKKIIKYMEGKTQDVPVDISKGGALRQLTHSLSLMEQIPKGGPLIWPILGIGLTGLMLILERVIYLLRRNIDVESFMNRIRTFGLKGRWEECIKICKEKKGKIIADVVLKGLENRHLNREDLENVLQETILNEIPKLERFLSTLGILAAIAPLLGLLGTVTGMINTFHVITYFGTGDPRLMSSGISEALITTMLGLGVAIPIMLFHSLISRWVDNYIAKLEENAVALVNMIFVQKK